MRRTGLYFMGLAALSFALMAWAIQQVRDRIPADEVVFFRSVVSVLLTLAWLVPRRLPLLGRRRGLLLLRGVMGFLGLYFYAEALGRMPLTDTAALHYTNPIFTAVFAALFLREGFSGRLAAALALCMAGALLVLRPRLEVPIEAGLIGLASGVSAGCAYAIVRALRTTEHAMTVVLAFPLVSIPVSGLLMLRHFVWPTPNEWLWLLAVGLFTQAGQVFLTLGLHRVEAAAATSVSYIALVFASLLDWFTHGRLPAPQVVAGSALIVGGILLISRRVPGSSGAAPPTEAPPTTAGDPPGPSPSARGLS